MHNYRYFLNDTEITDDIIYFNYSEDIDDVASSFAFKAIRNYGITSNVNGRQSINKLTIFDVNNISLPFYVGYIFTMTRTDDRNIFEYSGYDVGFYLNNNKVLQKAQGNIATVIRQLCNVYGITLGVIPNFSQNVYKIYKNIDFSEILKELLELERNKGGLTGVYIDCKSEQLNILRYQIERNLSALITEIMSVPSDNTYSNISVKDSVENLKNRVIYTNNDEKSAYAIPKDEPTSIATFGLLSTVETIDTSKTNNLNLTAQNKLNELNKIETEIGLTVLGDYRISKGKVLDITVPEYDLNGTYLIKSTNHIMDKNKETVKISIEQTIV